MRREDGIQGTQVLRLHTENALTRNEFSSPEKKEKKKTIPSMNTAGEVIGGVPWPLPLSHPGYSATLTRSQKRWHQPLDWNPENWPK